MYWMFGIVYHCGKVPDKVHNQIYHTHMAYYMFNVIVIFGISFIRIVQMNIRALSFSP